MPTTERGGWVAAVAAVLLFSTTPVLIRLAAPLQPVHITLVRLLVAAAVVLAVATLLGQAPWRERRRWRYAGYGLATALHFLLYIASLSYTTIAHSLALVYTAPIFVSAFAWLLLGEPLARRRWLGVLVTCLGVAVLAGFEPAMDARMLLGDALAVGSAVCFGLYSVAGRYERGQTRLLTYVGHVYGAAALWILPVIYVFPFPPAPGRALAAVLALGLGPLALGHTLYNAALRRLHPTFVNLVATQEVAGGILLGALILGEVPSEQSVLGVALTLLGVLLVLL